MHAQCTGVVITSYGQIRSAHENALKESGTGDESVFGERSPLIKSPPKGAKLESQSDDQSSRIDRNFLEWTLVVADEGHTIKNPITKQFRAMRALPAQQRLLLTGTPIQNNLETKAKIG